MGLALSASASGVDVSRGPAARPDAPLTRLALFTDTWVPQVNGVARTLDRLVAECERRGVEARVFTVADEAAVADAAAREARRVERWPARPFWAYPQLRMAAPSPSRARAALERFRPSLVHVATPFGLGLSGRQAARALGVPLVSSYHTHFTAYLAHYGLQGLDAVSWPFLRWFHNGGERTFVPTRDVARQLDGHGFAGVRLWGRGIDAHRFSPAHRSEALRASLGCQPDTLLVLYVGRLAPEKGVDVAMRAMAPVLQAAPHRVRFALVGDGPAEAALRAAAPAGVHFLGRLEGQPLAEAYASADVFLFPSTTETFGNVVLEAMASGLAVIAHASGATTEFAHEATALPVDVREADQLSAAVRTLLDDPARRRALADAGRREAEHRAWDRIWDALFAEYGDVLAARAPRAPAARVA
jgi:phosphatidylinositol alpha 1,6-mannosyltransferase